jgi:hypothetical protein
MWSAITLLRLIHHVGDLSHKEVRPDDEIPSNPCNIIVLGIQNNESFILENDKIIIKCGRQICRHIFFLSRLQTDPKQLLDMSA